MTENIDIKRKKRKNKKKTNLPFIFLFFVGFTILCYPLISRTYYSVKSKDIVYEFDFEKSKLSKEDVKKRMNLAKYYNASLHNISMKDPYTKENKEHGRKEYAKMLEIKEYIGHVNVPSINIDIPIYAGTTEEILQKGAGHLEKTSLPIGGINSHCVITAHSGLPTATLFTNLSKVEIGDKFYIHNFYEILAYQVDQIKIVEPSDFNDLLIVKNKDYVTLLTCTPYMINTHRLLVRGHRVKYDKDILDKEILEGKKNMYFMYLFYLLLFLTIIFIILTLYYILKRKKLNKKLKENI